MAYVGELFKFLGSNFIFQDFCKNYEKTNQQIIADVFQNEELIAKLRNIVQDDNIIKNKMDILIGQKRKNQNKKQEQSSKQNTNDQKEEIREIKEIKEVDEVREFKFIPINPSKVTYLDNFAYIEQVDHRLRLVTHDFEMYY
jgi:hypothetical protein